MERKQIIYKYSQLKIYHSDDQLQVYMYAFMYVDPETFSVEDHFPAKKSFFSKQHENGNSRNSPKNWTGFSYIR